MLCLLPLWYLFWWVRVKLSFKIKWKKLDGLCFQSVLYIYLMFQFISERRLFSYSKWLEERRIDIGTRIEYRIPRKSLLHPILIKELRLKCNSTCDTGISQVKSCDQSDVGLFVISQEGDDTVKEGRTARQGWGVEVPHHLIPMGHILNFGY